MAVERAYEVEDSFQRAAQEKLEKDFLSDGFMAADFSGGTQVGAKKLFLSTSNDYFEATIIADEEQIDIELLKGETTLGEYAIRKEGVFEYVPRKRGEEDLVKRTLNNGCYKPLKEAQVFRLYNQLLSTHPDTEALKDTYNMTVTGSPSSNEVLVWVKELPCGLPFSLPFPEKS